MFLRRLWRAADTACLPSLGLPLGRDGLHRDLLRFLPAGLRAGGATDDYLVRQNLGRLQWRGRWATVRVMEHYLQMGTFVLADIRMPVSAQRLVDRYAEVCLTFFSSLGEPTVPPPLTAA